MAHYTKNQPMACSLEDLHSYFHDTWKIQDIEKFPMPPTPKRQEHKEIMHLYA